MYRNLIDGNSMRRFGHLLDMQYTPAEIADEIGLDKQAVYTKLIPAGLPNTKDDKGHIWIHGLAAKQWAQAHKKERHHMAEGEGFCLTCKTVVKVKAPKHEQKNGASFVRGQCPKCGRVIVRLTGRASA